MFTVKATYGNETRKFAFPDSSTFPTYNEIHEQLSRLFPIRRNYYLSRLIFSPDASRPGRVLIGKEVHSAEDYDSYIAPLRRVWPNPLLRFTIFDETHPQKASSAASERLSLYSTSTVPSSDITYKLLPPVGPRQSVASLNSQLPVFPPPPPRPSVLPTPPMTFSPTLPESLSFPEHAGKFSSCCSVTKGRADLEILLSSFKEDLERILSRTLGTEQVGRQPTLAAQASTWGVSSTNVVPPQVDDPPNVNFNKSRWCFVCRSSFAGVWYGCIKCPWHAVCPGCFSKSHSAHTLSFGPSHIIQQRSLDGPQASGRIPRDSESHCSGSQICPLPQVTSSSSAGEPARPVHRGVVCDGCNETVVGVRHKCLDCPDYDLCTVCMESGALERHSPFHEFFDIEIPGRVYVHTVLSGDRGRSIGDRRRVPSPNPAQVAQQGLATPVDPPVPHSASCNLCDSEIVGERYKCVVCPDFDTCSSCFRITTDQHPSHGFVRLNKPEDLMMPGHGSIRHHAHHARCDSCGKMIFGTRYKCMHQNCPDFDLCSNCEALPIPVHPLNHPMLKLRIADTTIPIVYRVGQTRMVDEPSGQQSTLVCNEPTVSPLPSSLMMQMGSPNDVSERDLNAATGGHSAEEFLSPLGSPKSDVLGESPSSAILHPINVAEPPESPLSCHSPLDIYHQVWPSVSRELMPPDAPNGKNPIVNVTEATVGEAVEPLLAESPPLTASVASAVSVVGEPRCIFPVSAATRSIFDCTPSPVLSNLQELRGTATQPPTDNREGIVATDVSQQSFLDSAFVGNTNVPDGQVFPPGAEFVKGWHMMNTGGLPWPATTEVQFVAGEMFVPEYSACLRAKVGVVHPGQDLDIWTGDLKAPDAPGRYVGYWRLNDGQGNFFGNRMWIDLTVADHHSDQASEESLAASSMVMPSVHPVNSVNAGLELEDALQPSLPSTETAMDGVADPESDISSVSLVSIPSSDDEDAEWQDTRSHSEPLEYVVLYDSNSEE